MVGEDETAEAMVLLMERCKLVVEGAGAVGVAALLGGQVTPAPRRHDRGGALGRQRRPGPARRGRAPPRDARSGRRLVLLTRVPDRPGRLARLLVLVAETGANIVDVSHVREGLDLHVRETAIELVLETRGHDHAQSRRRGAPRRRLRDARPELVAPSGATSLAGCSVEPDIFVTIVTSGTLVAGVALAGAPKDDWPKINGELYINSQDTNTSHTGTAKNDELLGGHGDDVLIGDQRLRRHLGGPQGRRQQRPPARHRARRPRRRLGLRQPRAEHDLRRPGR